MSSLGPAGSLGSAAQKPVQRRIWVDGDEKPLSNEIGMSLGQAGACLAEHREDPLHFVIAKRR